MRKTDIQSAGCREEKENQQHAERKKQEERGRERERERGQMRLSGRRAGCEQRDGKQ